MLYLVSSMIPLSKFQLLRLKKLSNQYQLELLVLFGSRAKGNFSTISDWDVGYKREDRLSYDELTDFLSTLSSIVNSENLDVVDIERTYDPLLLKEIYLGGFCLYEKQENLFDKEQNRAWSAYLDFEPNYKLQEEIINLRLQKLSNK